MFKSSVTRTDFFASLTEKSVVKSFCLTFAFLASWILPIFLWSIVWFEKHGTDNRRTLINKFASSGCWCAIEYFIFAQTLDNIRYIYGPLSKSLCFFIRVVKSTIFFQMFLYLDLIVLSRYLYIFHLKNPAGFADDFWALFFNLWVAMVSLLVKRSYHFVSIQHTMTYYFCCGLDPRISHHSTRRNNFLT
jgi:hypothetical protein